MEGQLLSKLYDMYVSSLRSISVLIAIPLPIRGVLNTTAKLSDIENKLTVAAFCRRRLGVVVCRLKMAESVSAVRLLTLSLVRALLISSLKAVTFVEQGHIRVGPDTITDPAYLVTRNMEDYVTWVDTSKMRRTVMAYNDEVRYPRYLDEWPLTIVDYSWTTLIYYESPHLVRITCITMPRHSRIS
jgi:hypothetical protein